jgi:hypothetical protein
VTEGVTLGVRDGLLLGAIDGLWEGASVQAGDKLGEVVGDTDGGLLVAGSLVGCIDGA